MFTRRSLLAASGILPGCATLGGSPTLLERLSSTFDGQIIAPNSSEYARARRVNTTNPRVEAQPIVIARCASVDDVARTIAFARRNMLELAVRAGGHDFLGTSTSNGVVLDLSLLSAIEVDAARGTVRVGGGAGAGALNDALAQRGLAVALGCDHRVGVGGVTLGGGLGWLIGRHGAACDNLIAAQLVTADGHLVRASARENPDLLWALKGGGGNFGVVTELTLAAHPMGEVIQGVIAYDAPRPAEFLRFFRDYVYSSGVEIDYELFILPRPTPCAFLKICYSGEPFRAERVLAPLLEYGPPLAHNLLRGAYTGRVDPSGAVAARFAATPPLPEPRADDVPGFAINGFTAAPLSDAAIGEIGSLLVSTERPTWSFGCGYVVHGAGVVDLDASAWPRRDGAISFFLARSWRRSEEADAAMAWVDATRIALQPYLTPTYINFICTDDPGVIGEAYGANFARLQHLKERWDPDNIFRRNRNISPG